MTVKEKIKEVDISLPEDPLFSLEELRKLIASKFSIEVVDQKDVGVEKWLLDKRK